MPTVQCNDQKLVLINARAKYNIFRVKKSHISLTSVFFTLYVICPENSFVITSFKDYVGFYQAMKMDFSRATDDDRKDNLGSSLSG